MKGEIDNDFYCTKDNYCLGICTDSGGSCSCATLGIDCGCKYPRHKWPTPEEFQKEYGEKYPDDGAVYFCNGYLGWAVKTYGEYKEMIIKLAEEAGHGDFLRKAKVYPAVCACTPWGKPPADWRPK